MFTLYANPHNRSWSRELSLIFPNLPTEVVELSNLMIQLATWKDSCLLCISWGHGH